MISIEPLTPQVGETDAHALEDLFMDLHEVLARKGMEPPLVPGGATDWLRTIRPLLGRLTFVLVARQDRGTVGFVAGQVRNLPAYLGGERIGMLSHIHVRPEVRGQGIGRRLVAAFADTLRPHGITRMETDVLVDNTEARAFFERAGFHGHHLVLRQPLT